MGDTTEILKEICRLGRSSTTRSNEFSSTAPCRWNPYAIENPETTFPFSDASAWELICRTLDETPELFTEMKLDKPPGQIAYWTVVTLSTGVCVYIKVQLQRGKAHGRSFHISTKE